MFSPVVKITVNHTHDASPKSEVFKANPEILNTEMSSETAAAFVSWTHDYIDLTDGTYEYSKVVETLSLNEIIAD